MKRSVLIGAVLLWAYVSFVGHPEAGALPAVPSAALPATAALAVAEPAWPEPQLSAQAYGVFLIEDGKVLFGQNVEVKLPIASVTKLFTAAAALRAAAHETRITITPADVATYGRAGQLSAGEVYTMHELLFPLLLESSNDAAAAIARTVGPISAAGRELADASGLSAGNQVSVSELVTEISRLYSEEPHIFDITRLTRRPGETVVWTNNSPVYDLAGYRGGKHGYTDAAGRTLVALFAEPALGDQVVGYVLLGSSDLRGDTEVLRAAVADSVTAK